MAVVTTEARGFLPYGRGLTRADLEAAPDDGHRYELIDGVLVVTPAPRIRHQDAVLNIAVIVRAVMPDRLKVMVAPVDVVLAEDTVIQPDLLVAPPDAFTESDLPGAPLLAVEVLSPSTRGFDLLLKKYRLERAGCPHYWVVDPDEPSVIAWDLADGVYREVAHAVGTELFEVASPFPVSFAPASLIA
ncbi:MAG: Uma2 family endonuclease [Nocardioidaceae bacterium]|nr:MAG: Uma2 family endonuclease [Nocardioidaceae bacterium]